MTPATAATATALRIRPVEVADGQAIWQLVRDSGVLDVNSLYCYLLLCRQFRDTCLVAEEAGEVLGFVTAFRPPAQPEVIFVWQIGVGASARGRGIAARLLDHLLRLPACGDVRWLETTVTPDNHASRALFHSAARRWGTRCEVLPGLGPELFPGTGHQPEKLHRIGPISERSHA